MGHTETMNKLCVALGSASGNDNGMEVRIIAKTNHIGSGFMHFKTKNKTWLNISDMHRSSVRIRNMAGFRIHTL